MELIILKRKGDCLMEIKKKQLNSLSELANMGLEIQPNHACYQHRLEKFMKKKHIVSLKDRLEELYYLEYNL